MEDCIYFAVGLSPSILLDRPIQQTHGLVGLREARISSGESLSTETAWRIVQILHEALRVQGIL